MSSQHRIAVDLIDRWFEAMNADGASSTLQTETTMIVETAYALSAISDDEHRHYKQRLNRLYAVQAQAFVTDIRRSAP